ncbi:MAG: tyrosine--tRNA ligase [Clostridia bacterium]|nr:tyrosine--tRNA ligase [Clostridia bacterium]
MSIVFSSPILQDLNLRGFLYQFTDAKAIDDLFCSKKDVVFYVGFDATAKSLHVGHLLWIKLVNKLQKAGAKPIIIVGGATSKIGDPTWKDTQRAMLDYQDILSNIDSIMFKLSRLIKFGEENSSARLLNNDEWISKINYMEFLRDFGPLFSINKMLAMDSVSSRLERQQHLSFLEFNYMLLQAYDFLYLYENHNCVLEIGGADQWSNMISGVDLIRRKTGKQAFGMSLSLLTNSDGKKMGKTEKGTVWIDEKLTSHFDFWQYWRNVDDKDVVKLLKLFTDVEISEIEKFEKLVGTKEINEAKILLADEVTKFVHEDADIESIKKTASGLFHGTSDPAENIEHFEIEKGTSIDKALVLLNLSKSQTLAKRLIEGKGVKLNGTIIEDFKYQIQEGGIISVGKKNFAKIKII